MIVFEIFGNEQHTVYQELEVSNGQRLSSFVESIVLASLQAGRHHLSHDVVKAFNAHAICCLHIDAGKYRPCEVTVGGRPCPPFYRVQALMDDMVNTVNRLWSQTDPLTLAAYVLWRINDIHPFINGNGRTARATAYFIICLFSGGMIRGTTTLPELLKRDRDEYVMHLRHADKTAQEEQGVDLAPLRAMIERLLIEQMNSVIDPPLTEEDPAPVT